MRKFVSAVAAVAMLAQSVPVLAAAKTFAVQGYALPADKPLNIVLMRPDVNVGELAAGGLPQPNADWTEAARKHIAEALKAEFGDRKINFSVMDEAVPAYRARMAAEQAKAVCPPQVTVITPASPETSTPVPIPSEPCVPPPAGLDAEKIVAEYTALNSAVTNSILAHQYGEAGFTTMPGKLPTKKGNFAFTMGPGAKQLGEISGGNYGLFMLTTDQFASAGRKSMQVLGLLGCGIGFCMVVSGGIHVAYVSLVELDTGNIVWFNLQRGSKGDVREEAGARDMVKAIMTGMPSRPGEMTGAVTKKTK